MEYYPLHPGTYGITIETFKPATTGKDVSRKRPRDEVSGDEGRNNEHDGSASLSSAAVNRPGNTRQRTGEPGEVNRNREVIEIPSSTSNAAPASSRTDSDEAKRLERRAAREQQLEDKRKRIRRENIAREVGHEVDSDGERQYWQECFARDRAEDARREALSPEVSPVFQGRTAGVLWQITVFSTALLYFSRM